MKKTSMVSKLRNVLAVTLLFGFTSQAYAIGNFSNVDKKELNKAPTITKEDDGDVVYDFDTFSVKFEEGVKQNKEEVAKFLKENKALGSVEVSKTGKIEFEGAFGDFKAVNFSQFKSKFLNAKKKTLSKHNLKHIANYDIYFAENKKHKKKQKMKMEHKMPKEQLKRVAREVVGDEGTIILFKQDMQDKDVTIVYGENSLGQASYRFLDDIIEHPVLERTSTKTFLK